MSSNTSPGALRRRGSLGDDELNREDAATEWPTMAEHMWVLAHRTIAHDLNDTSIALERMLVSPHVDGWEFDVMRMWWRRVTENIVLHHTQEETILFPSLREKIDIPQKISGDHMQMLTMLGRIASTFDRLGDDVTPAHCLRAIDDLTALMLPHMREEEVVVLPAMAAAFTPREVKKIEKRMTQHFTHIDAPHHYRSFGNDLEKKRAHFSRSRGSPGFLFDVFVARDFELYDQEFGWMIDVLIDPGRKTWSDEQQVMRRAFSSVGVKCIPSHSSSRRSSAAGATVAPMITAGNSAANY